MLRLRPYKPCDANSIVNWCNDEQSFRMWSSDRYDSYPISPADMNNKYYDWNGDCVEADNFYPMTCYDELGIAGHFIMRYTNGDKQSIRLGWVIVHPDVRGQGYGKQMVKLALDYAFNFLQANRVTVGVFDKNTSAYYCYVSAGFKNVQVDAQDTYRFNDEIWSVLEMEITREEYERKNSRSQIFTKNKCLKRKQQFNQSFVEFSCFQFLSLRFDFTCFLVFFLACLLYKQFDKQTLLKYNYNTINY